MDTSDVTIQSRKLTQFWGRPTFVPLSEAKGLHVQILAALGMTQEIR